MNRQITACIALCLVLAAGCGTGTTNGPDLETIAPEQAGWSGEKLDELAAYADSVGYTAIVLAQGARFSSPGDRSPRPTRLTPSASPC